MFDFSDEFVAPPPAALASKALLINSVLRLKPVDDAAAEYDVGIVTAYDADSDQHEFKTFLKPLPAHRIALADYTVMLFKPDAERIHDELHPDEHRAVAVPRAARGKGGDSRPVSSAEGVSPSSDDRDDDARPRSPVHLVSAASLLPSASLPAVFSARKDSPAPITFTAMTSATTESTSIAIAGDDGIPDGSGGTVGDGEAGTDGAGGASDEAGKKADKASERALQRELERAQLQVKITLRLRDCSPHVFNPV